MQTIRAHGALLAIAGAVLVVTGCGIPAVSPADIAINNFNFAKTELVRTITSSDDYNKGRDIRFGAAYIQREILSQDYVQFCNAYHAVVYVYEAAHDSENYRKWRDMTVPELKGKFLQEYMPSYCP